MSAEDNKCNIPKIAAGEYGQLLVHNPGEGMGNGHEPDGRQLIREGNNNGNILTPGYREVV